jgi:hypothetical protein
MGGVPIFFEFSYLDYEVIPYNALNSEFANFETPCMIFVFFFYTLTKMLPEYKEKSYMYYCGQKKWDINVIVLTFNVK